MSHPPPATPPSISVVIVTYWTGPVLFDCLASVLAQPELADIIVVDNGNDEGARRRLFELAAANSRIRVLTGHGNVGFAAGCNRGANLATGDYLLLLNPDCVLTDGVLGRLVALLDARPEGWIISPRLVSEAGVPSSGTPRNLLTPWTAVVEGLRLDRVAPHHPYFQRLKVVDLPPGQAVVSVPATSGAFMLMPRRVYDLLGGMDERYFLHVEDLDFCLRAVRRGGVILLAAEHSVTHLGATSQAWWPVIELHKARSASHYFHLHFSRYYPTVFLWLASALLYARFAAILLLRALLPRRSARD